MAKHYYWRQAGTTGRTHLVLRLDSAQGTYPASMSECGMVRDAAWVPPGRSSKCGLCRRLVARRELAKLRALVKMAQIVAGLALWLLLAGCGPGPAGELELVGLADGGVCVVCEGEDGAQFADSTLAWQPVTCSRACP